VPVDSGTIAAQIGAAGGLWTHTPVDWAGNEPPGPTPKPAGWPNNAAQGYFGPGEGTRPGGAITQSGPAGAPKMLSINPVNLTTTSFGVSVVFDAAVTSSRVNYGTTQAVASTAAGTTAAAQTIAVPGLTTQTVYWFSVQATNASGTSVSNLFTVTTF